jgi:hypothetical protein
VRPKRVFLDADLLRTFSVKLADGSGTQVFERPTLAETWRRVRALHAVEAHTVRVWVREPRKGEGIMATRERTTRDGESYTLYAVRRPRAGHMRGGGNFQPRLVEVIPSGRSDRRAQ